MSQVFGKNIAAALLAVQQEIDSVVKDTENPYFKSQYADLSSVIDVLKPVLNKHGIVFTQMPVKPTFEGTLALATVLIHVESGEFIEGVAEVPLTKADPQGYGSAMTYTRRYSLVSALGLKTVDDDGNAASDSGKSLPPTQAAKPKPTGGFKLGGGSRPQVVKPVAAPQRTKSKGLFPKVKAGGVDPEDQDKLET